jgi:UDP-N-acetylglucosamine 1-carboxyvinyltransferase
LASFIIKGGIPLSGELRIHGAKNAALPILAASIMASGDQKIIDVPELIDIKIMIKILKTLGVKASHVDQMVTLNTSSLLSSSIPDELMGKMRSSIFLMGPLLAKLGEVRVSRPGGCAIGERPIDLHLSGLKQLGAEIKEENGEIHCKAKQLFGANIHLRFPSVGATENIMMAATLAEGTTVITNAAREPEIIDLQNYLNKMGGLIRGAGTDRIEVVGVKELQSVEYHIIPDRIITGTILLAAAITRGEVALTNVRPEHLASLLSILEDSGVDIRTYRDIIKLKANKASNALNAVGSIQTGPHPSFPTDMQAQMMSYLSTVEGTSVIKEQVFEGRLKHVNELNRMGSKITVDLNTAFIRGVPSLYGTSVEATDLRAGAALVIAGLQAKNTTTVTNIHHIDRGYQHLECMLQVLGAEIDRV